MQNTIRARLPRGDIITASHTGTLNLPSLPTEARTACIFPDLAHHSLLSLCALCDAGCTAAFDKDTATISHNNTVALQGIRNIQTNLWHAPTQPQTQVASATTTESAVPHTAQLIIQTSDLSDQIQCLHAACLSPVKSALLRAIQQGHFVTWPGSTELNVKKCLPVTAAAAKGHMDQQRRNKDSTKLQAPAPNALSEDTLCQRSMLLRSTFVATSHEILMFDQH